MFIHKGVYIYISTDRQIDLDLNIYISIDI